MITSLQGLVQHIGDNEIVIEVGGVGLQVSVPADVLEAAPAIGQPFFLHTHLIVREDRLALYGFRTPEQRELFNMLLQVSGVGPRLALSVLSNLPPETLRSAVANSQPEVLASVPGIGRKTGEKIIFHLKDRLALPEMLESIPSQVDGEVIGVLTALGYTLMEAQAALRSIPPDAEEDVENRVRLALRYFRQQ